MPKEAIIHSSIDAVDIIDTPIPTPKDNQVVIQVVVSGSNPKDWKYPLWKSLPHNSGDDIAGVVHTVGKDVYEFKKGDRVAALHEFATENGSYAEYSVAPDFSTFHIPHNISFEEAATIPTAALTAAVALYIDLKLPPPYNPVKLAKDKKKVPILIYGVTSAVGAFAAKLARLSGLGPIIGIAGRAGEFAKDLVDHAIDYRNGEDALVIAVEQILEKEGLGKKVPVVLDAISENGSLEATVRFIDPIGGVVSTVLPPKLFAKNKEEFEYPSGVSAVNSALPIVFSAHKDFGYIWSRYLGRLLEDGRLEPHPHEVIPGGLNGVLIGLKNLKDGKASGMKYVFRIAETEDEYFIYEQPVQTNQQPHALEVFPFPS